MPSKEAADLLVRIARGIRMREELHHRREELADKFKTVEPGGGQFCRKSNGYKRGKYGRRGHSKEGV